MLMPAGVRWLKKERVPHGLRGSGQIKAVKRPAQGHLPGALEKGTRLSPLLWPESAWTQSPGLHIVRAHLYTMSRARKSIEICRKQISGCQGDTEGVMWGELAKRERVLFGEQ